MIRWKGRGNKGPWPNLRCSPCVFFEEERETTKYHNQYSLSPGKDLNPGHPEYES
jgi:hypothetical protein